MAERVLVIDDEENIREMTRLALETAGYEVGEADSGLEAFAIIGADESWDAVLLDQKMPGMIGTEILRRLKIMLPAARVIMMTAYASVDLAVQAMKLGASDFVRKPMTPEILRNAVAAALAKGPEGHETNSAEVRPHEQSRHVTLNGFTILRARDMLGVVPHRSNECVFIVRAPNGRDQEVVVEIAPGAISAVEKVTTDFPLAKGFWTEQAEQFLSDFLWNDGNVPATGRLTLKGVEHEALRKAPRKEVSK
jgi:CheY-like chemotaxis protein